MGGAGAAVLEVLSSKKITLPTLNLGLPDLFIDHGDPQMLLSMHGLDKAGIINSLHQQFGDLLKGSFESVHRLSGRAASA